MHTLLDPRNACVDVSNLHNIAAPLFTRQHIQYTSAHTFPLKASYAFNTTHVLRATAVDRELSLDSSEEVFYEALKQRLQAGEWEAADEETRRLLCVLAGEAAAKRKWVYFSEAKFIESRDMRTLDSLWRTYSNNKFGYSTQRRIWKSVNGNWTSFFRKVGWTRPLDDKNDVYRKFPIEFMWDAANPTPDGHLPLTNCLRGTQLLEQILLHPALDEIERNEGLSGNSNGSSFM